MPFQRFLYITLSIAAFLTVVMHMAMDPVHQSAIGYVVDKGATSFCIGEPETLTETTYAVPVWWAASVNPQATVHTAIVEVNVKNLDNADPLPSRNLTGARPQECPIREWVNIDSTIPLPEKARNQSLDNAQGKASVPVWDNESSYIHPY